MINNDVVAGRVDICGIGIDRISFQETVEAVTGLVAKGTPSFIATCNVDHIIKLRKDPDFMAVYKQASFVVPDGIPLLWAASFLGTSLKGRVNGTDLFEKLCEISVGYKYRLFFLGGRSGAADGAAGVLRTRYPGIQIVGTYSPPLGFENNEAENGSIISMIRDARADILFVGLGAPKQEKWICKYKDEYKVPLSIGIGVSFEFIAGMVKRAPVWMQRAGLEWLWRVLMEPSRLWKRYFIDDMKFFWFLLNQKFGKK